MEHWSIDDYKEFTNGSKKKSKYRSYKISIDGNRFDSQKEAGRYDQLILRQQAGEIRDLRLQVDFTLQEAYTDQEGRRIRAIRYRADFTYRERDGRLVVEDVKSRPTRTREYLIKRKLMKERRGIDITEV